MPTRSCVHPTQVGDLPVVGHVIPYQLPQCRGHGVVARLGFRREGDRPVQVLVGERDDVLPSRRLNPNPPKRWCVRGFLKRRKGAPVNLG